jgi:hypothetical protein
MFFKWLRSAWLALCAAGADKSFPILKILRLPPVAHVD